MSQKLPIRLRLATMEDAPFIFNSWLKSYRRSLFARNITNPIYFQEHHKVIERVALGNKIIMACNNEDPTQVYGYICAGEVDEIFVVHYVYVKQSFRNLGIAKILVDAFGHKLDTAALYTHHTKPMERLASKYNFIYHPYLLFNEEYYKDLASKQTEAVEENKAKQENKDKPEQTAEVTKSDIDSEESKE